MSHRPLGSRRPLPGRDVQRISLMIGGDDRASLERIANEKRTSLAWVVRDALTRYLALPENALQPQILQR